MNRDSAEQKDARRAEFSRHKMTLIAVCIVAITGLLGVSAVGMNIVLEKLHLGRATLPTLKQLNSGVMVYDRTGKYVCTLREGGDRKPVPLSKISKNAQNAFIAVEDHRFNQHIGIDPWAIIRAFRANQEAGRIVEGGSTLTQQLVKNLFLDPNDKSYMRKFREAFMALGVDAKNWKVYTHFDPKAQTLAQNALNNGIAHAPKGINQGALVSMSIEDGGVLAIVGGVGDYEKAQWNRALNPHTAGSAFKPFVYLSALMSGAIQPDTLILDAPLKIEIPNQKKAYEPKNYDGTFKGWMPARSALMQSRNVCSIRVAHKVGIPAVIEAAQLAGIKSQLDSYIPLALGCCAVTPLEMATSYATLARGGVFMPSQIVKRIETEEGVVYRTYRSAPSANLPPEPTLQLVDVLVDAVRGGTGHRAYLGSVPVAGKTGTANKAKDLWFVGFTPEVVTAVWGGNDLNKEVAGHRVTGGVVIAGIWKQYMSGLLQSHKPKVLAFAQPGEKLAYTVPKYDPQSVLYPGMSVTREQAIAACWQIDNTAALDKITEDGVVRAAELQRNQAIKMFRSIAVAPQAIATQYGL